MYAVIRTGGKQYKVAPGDVLHVEKLAPKNGKLEFTEVLAASSDNTGNGSALARPVSAKVLATVLNEGRDSKVLVFHFKRKKQYKKTQGHRQSYTRIRIEEIQIEGKSYTAGK